jgi:AcrR family transcriptional regulator
VTDELNLPASPRGRRRLQKRLPVLRSLAPSAGRAKAGADTAARRKAQTRRKILKALEDLERSEQSRRPSLGEVSRASGVSEASIRRHCQSSLGIAEAIHFSRKDAPNRAPNSSFEEIQKMEFVILEISARNSALEEENQNLREANEKLRTRLSVAQSASGPTYF